MASLIKVSDVAEKYRQAFKIISADHDNISISDIVNHNIEIFNKRTLSYLDPANPISVCGNLSWDGIFDFNIDIDLFPESSMVAT